MGNCVMCNRDDDKLVHLHMTKTEPTSAEIKELFEFSKKFTKVVVICVGSNSEIPPKEYFDWMYSGFPGGSVFQHLDPMTLDLTNLNKSSSLWLRP